MGVLGVDARVVVAVVAWLLVIVPVLSGVAGVGEGCEDGLLLRNASSELYICIPKFRVNTEAGNGTVSWLVIPFNVSHVNISVVCPLNCPSWVVFRFYNTTGHLVREYNLTLEGNTGKAFVDVGNTTELAYYVVYVDALTGKQLTVGPYGIRYYSESELLLPEDPIIAKMVGLVPMALMVAFAVRGKPKMAGLGLIVYSVIISPILLLFGITPAMAILITSIAFIIGIILIITS